MAEPIDFDVRPARTEATASEEWNKLLQTLHEQGLLRLANDLAAANKGILEILVGGLNTPGARNAIQNLSAVAMLLGQVPPGTFYHVGAAFKEATVALTAAHSDQHEHAPGVRGVYRLLNDDEIWRGLAPLLRAASKFGGALHQPVPEKPITAVSGKPSDA